MCFPIFCNDCPESCWISFITVLVQTMQRILPYYICNSNITNKQMIYFLKKENIIFSPCIQRRLERDFTITGEWHILPLSLRGDWNLFMESFIPHTSVNKCCNNICRLTNEKIGLYCYKLFHGTVSQCSDLQTIIE